jgi:hypothetical protein
MASTTTGAVAGATQLPATGTGGPASASISIMVLLLMSAIALVAGAAAALLGRRQRTEDDGIVVE